MATATEVNILEAQPRQPGNKNAARRVRAAGKVPGVVYGAGKWAFYGLLGRSSIRVLRQS